MSTLTDQIKAKCATIAQTTKKIYDKGFADGKASVKHVTFYMESQWETYSRCAMSDMTWREYVDSDMNNGEFSIKDRKVYYSDDQWVSTYEDDVIIDNAYYFLLNDILYTNDELYCSMNLSLEENIRQYNSDKYFIDDNNYIVSTDGRVLMWAELSYGWRVANSSHYVDTSFISYTLSDDKIEDLIFYHLYDSVYVAKRGMTWGEYCSSSYSNSWYHLDGDRITSDWGEYLYYNDELVKPTDIIIDGGRYSCY